MHGDRVHVQNVGLNSNTRRGSECMETEFMDINLHNLSEIYYLIFLVTTFHCRYCTFCGISFKSKEGFWKHGYRDHVVYFSSIRRADENICLF